MADLGDVVANDQLRNQNLGLLVTALQNAFPQASTSVTLTATAGTATLPVNPTAFLTLTVSGTSYKIPLYKP